MHEIDGILPNVMVLLKAIDCLCSLEFTWARVLFLKHRCGRRDFESSIGLAASPRVECFPCWRKWEVVIVEAIEAVGAVEESLGF